MPFPQSYKPKDAGQNYKNVSTAARILLGIRTVINQQSLIIVSIHSALLRFAQ